MVAGIQVKKVKQQVRASQALCTLTVLAKTLLPTAARLAAHSKQVKQSMDQEY
jgi:hypothetical protein